MFKIPDHATIGEANHFKLGVKAVMEWGKETCPHYIFGEGTQCYKHACDMCWESLKQSSPEVKANN